MKCRTRKPRKPHHFLTREEILAHKPLDESFFDPLP
jgi:hypothetical protein